MRVRIDYDDPETKERKTVEHEVRDLWEAEDLAYSLSDKCMTYKITTLLRQPPKPL